MDDQFFQTSLVNEEILVLQMGGTIDQDYPKPYHGTEMLIGESAVKKILAKIRPLRSILVRLESIAKKNGSDLSEEDRLHLIHTVLSSKNHRFLVTHGTDTITQTASRMAKALIDSGIEDKSVVFTGSTTPERFRDSDADLNVGVALGFLQSGRTGVWVCLGALVLPWDRSHTQKDGLFVPRRRSKAVIV